MRKIEMIWHHVLYQALQEEQYKHTQKELAEKFGYSLSTVHYSLKVPSRIGAVRKTSRFFVLEDFEKLLYYWASVRDLQKDVVFEGYVKKPVLEIEGLVPPESIYGAYSAVRKRLEEPAADYNKVYFYLSEEKKSMVIDRFGENSEQEPNVIMLNKMEGMEEYGQVTSLIWSFVDIWNLRDWYAREFIKQLNLKFDELLS